MNAKVNDLMSTEVIALQRHHTVGTARTRLQKHGIQALPVVNTDGVAEGIVTSTDLVAALPENKPVSQVMTPAVLTIPQYADVSDAARAMRNHHIHHVVVTHEKKVVGIISSFDLLKLVENHRFTMKNPPTSAKRAGAYKSEG